MTSPSYRLPTGLKWGNPEDAYTAQNLRFWDTSMGTRRRPTAQELPIVDKLETDLKRTLAPHMASIAFGADASRRSKEAWGLLVMRVVSFFVLKVRASV